MKKHIFLILALFISFITFFFNTIEVKAVTQEEITAKDMKDRWYDTRYYPSYKEYKQWRKYSMNDILDILNPPLDLLLSMSTEELADLMQDYPCMGQIMTYINPDGSMAYHLYFSFIEMYCDIFYELLRREDGIICLLEEYRKSKYVEMLNEGGNSSEDIYQMSYAEIFGCQFIRHYAHHFTENEYELARQIIEEKKELYSLLDNTNLYFLDLPEIEAPTGEKESSIRTNYLRPEEIQEKEDKLAAALLQLQLNKNSLPEVSPGIEDNSTENHENNNESIVNNSIMSEPDDKAAAEKYDIAAEDDDDTNIVDVVVTDESVGIVSHQQMIIVVGAIIGVVCVIVGFMFYRLNRKKKE